MSYNMSAATAVDLGFVVASALLVKGANANPHRCGFVAAFALANFAVRQYQTWGEKPSTKPFVKQLKKQMTGNSPYVRLVAAGAIVHLGTLLCRR